MVWPNLMLNQLLLVLLIILSDSEHSTNSYLLLVLSLFQEVLWVDRCVSNQLLILSEVLFLYLSKELHSLYYLLLLPLHKVMPKLVVLLVLPILLKLLLMKLVLLDLKLVKNTLIFQL